MMEFHFVSIFHACCLPGVCDIICVSVLKCLSANIIIYCKISIRISATLHSHVIELLALQHCKIPRVYIIQCTSLCLDLTWNLWKSILFICIWYSEYLKIRSELMIICYTIWKFGWHRIR